MDYCEWSVLPVKYIRRFLWFIASKLLVFSLIAALFILAFYLAMNAANIYVLLSDGMKERTEIILTADREQSGYLNEFFRMEFLDNDEALRIGLSPESPYLNYKITGFESEVTLEWVWSWPWEDVAQATIVYRVNNIKGSVASGKSALVKAGKISSTPPAWQGGRYQMELYRVNGQWKIAGMRQTQVIVDTTPAPKPTLSPTAVAQ